MFKAFLFRKLLWFFLDCMNKDTYIIIKKDIEYSEKHHAVIPQLT